MLLKKPSFVWVMSLLIASVVFGGCKPRLEVDCVDLTAATHPDATIKIAVEDLEVIKQATTGVPEAEEQWLQKTTFFAPESNWGTWLTMLEIQPRLEMEMYAESPIPLPSETELQGFLLIRNAWKKPHTLRIIFLIDFQQVHVLQGASPSYYYDFPLVEPQEDRGVKFSLPTLSEGFHQLSILTITDAGDDSTDNDYRFLQQKSFSEQRYDLWIGNTLRPSDAPFFDYPELGMVASNRFANIQVIRSPNDKASQPLETLSLQAEQKTCLNLRFFNAPPEADTTGVDAMPLHIAVFWDDELSEIVDYDFPPDAPENLTLPIKVKAPSEAGSYQLGIVVFTFPGYSQFKSIGERTGFPMGAFSRRILVEVQP